MVSEWQRPVATDEGVLLKPLDYATVHIQAVDDHGSLGLPAQYRSISLLDWSLIAISWTCGGLALLSVFNLQIATRIGQTYQLIVVGFLLSIMAFCWQGRSVKTFFAIEILRGRSSLQNLEAILQLDCTISGASFMLRASLLFLLAFPLGLSIAYKSFAGGRSVTRDADRRMQCGITPPPGTQNSGYGLSLFSDTFLPYWSDPKYQQAYGYSMWSDSATRVALLDGPLDKDIRAFQDSLRADQAGVIEATVSAVQTDLVVEWDDRTLPDIDTNELRSWLGYGSSNYDSWNNTELLKAYLQGSEADTNFLYLDCRVVSIACCCYGGGCPADSVSRNTFFLTSHADTKWTGPQQLDAFFHAAQGFQVSLKRYKGTWNVTRSTSRLVNAVLLSDAPLADENYNFDDVFRTVFETTYYLFPSIYSIMLVEYDWKFPWARSDAAACDPTPPESMHLTNVTSDTAFIATMVWSRVATKWGPTSIQYGLLDQSGNGKASMEYTTEAKIYIHTETLKRHLGLAVVILVLPLLTAISVLLRLLPWLRGAPVSNGFGLISMLAAVDSKTLALLDGAGYSGKVSRTVNAEFSSKMREDALLVRRSMPEQTVVVALSAEDSGRGSRDPRIRLRKGALCR